MKDKVTISFVNKRTGETIGGTRDMKESVLYSLNFLIEDTWYTNASTVWPVQSSFIADYIIVVEPWDSMNNNTKKAKGE